MTSPVQPPMNDTSAPIARVASNPLPAATPSPISSLEGAPSLRNRSLSTGHRDHPSSPLRNISFAWRRAPRNAESSSTALPLKWWAQHQTKSSSADKETVVLPEHVEGWIRARENVSRAVANVLGSAGDVVHETLLVSVDVLDFAPLPGLRIAARTLLGIWDTLQDVDINRLACLGLTERCASILLSVRQEAAEAGDILGEELLGPIARLVDSFTQVQRFMQKQTHRPFLTRYLKRDELHRNLQACDHSLNDALGMFSLSIQIRILKQVLHAEEKRQMDTVVLVERLLQTTGATTAARLQTLQILGKGAEAARGSFACPKPAAKRCYRRATRSRAHCRVSVRAATGQDGCAFVQHVSG